MKFIHSANILHRDLKPSNILLNKDCDLKICDFGLARGINFTEQATPTMSTAYVQSRWYRAPELMMNWNAAAKALDMWSVGCIFAELLARKPLFCGNGHIDHLRCIIDILGEQADEDIMGTDSVR